MAQDRPQNVDTPDPRGSQTQAGAPADGRPGSATGPGAQPPAAAAGAKADPTKRVIAAVIDGLLTFVVGMVPVIGGLVGAAYWLVRDGLEVPFMDNRSIGKKLMKMRPLAAGGAPVDIVGSVKRNWVFIPGAVAQVLLLIPVVGWLLVLPVALVGLALVVIEAVLIFTDDDGLRMGDKYAGTVVREVAD